MKNKLIISYLAKISCKIKFFYENIIYIYNLYIQIYMQLYI
jgi:hypothetical protein